KTVEVRVKPEHHVTLAPASTIRSRYLLGVQVTPLEGALRSQLGLPDTHGLLVSSVEPSTPAEKAGLKKNDVLLSIGDKPLTGTDDLVKWVQDSGGKSITLKFFHAGKEQTLEITPVERKESIELGVNFPERTVFTAVRPVQRLRSGAVVSPPASTAVPKLPSV